VIDQSVDFCSGHRVEQREAERSKGVVRKGSCAARSLPMISGSSAHVIATGLSDSECVPRELAPPPGGLLSHSSAHQDLSHFKGTTGRQL
jgi:hypothetical protein